MAITGLLTWMGFALLAWWIERETTVGCEHASAVFGVRSIARGERSEELVVPVPGALGHIIAAPPRTTRSGRPPRRARASVGRC
jgi:hypothetical protein